MDMARSQKVLELSDRMTARNVNVSRDTVHEYVERILAAGLLRWDQIVEMAESELEKLLFLSRAFRVTSRRFRELDWKKIHKELSCKS